MDGESMNLPEGEGEGFALVGAVGDKVSVGEWLRQRAGWTRVM